MKSRPQHDVAVRNLDKFGQMMTMKIRGGGNGAMAFYGAVRVARRVTRTGGAEALVKYQRSIEMVKVTHGGIVRISAGIEDEEDLLDDFSKALQVVERVVREGVGAE